MATWNLERAAPDSPAGILQRQAIAGAGADVWVFTEAHDALAPQDFETTSSELMRTTEPARFTTIAAELLQPIAVPELPTGAAAVVSTAERDWLLVGVCMPWRHGAPALPPGAAGEATTGPDQWRAVLMSLDRALHRLRSRHPGIPLVLAGDFNQTLDGYVVGSREGRRLLGDLLLRHDLTAHTATAPAAVPDCSSIDHICGPTAAGDVAVETWMPATLAPSGRLISDHAGYLVTLS